MFLNYNGSSFLMNLKFETVIETVISFKSERPLKAWVYPANL